MANSRTYRRWFAAFIVGLVAITFAVSFSLINSRLRSAYFTPVPGHLKPVWSVTDLKGRTWTSASLRGKIVVLDFWATWCSPCRREMPILNKLQHEYASRGVQVIGLSVDPIDKHSAYRRLEQVAFGEYGLAAMSHRGGVLGWPEPLPPLAKYALTYVYVQAEFGVCCPLSMTDALARNAAYAFGLIVFFWGPASH